jgi:hypothetical protein
MVLIYLNSVGCSNWHLVERTEFQEIRKDKPRIKVELIDGSVFETKKYYITPDSLVIFTAKTPFYQGNIRAIPLAKIATIEMLKIDPQKTVVVLGIVGVLGFYAIISAIQELNKAYSGLGH